MTKPSEKTWRPRIEERWIEDALDDDPGWDCVPDYPPKRPRPRTRKLNLKALLRQAAKAGLTVRSVVVEGECTRLELGEPGPTPERTTADSDTNEWDADLGTLPPSLRQ
jgi:hypothetical protein